MIANKTQILKLSSENSILSMCLYQYRLGHCTWDEAMMTTVAALVAENKVLSDQVINQLNQSVTLLRKVDDYE